MIAKEEKRKTSFAGCRRKLPSLNVLSYRSLRTGSASLRYLKSERMRSKREERCVLRLSLKTRK